MPPPTPHESAWDDPEIPGWLIAVLFPDGIEGGLASIDADAVRAAHERLELVYREAERHREAVVAEVEVLREQRRQIQGRWAQETVRPLDELQAVAAIEQRILEAQPAVSEAIGRAVEAQLARNSIAGIDRRIALARRMAELARIQAGPDHVPVAPTGENRQRPEVRYFRMLVWNLENFTRDQRPRGAASMTSPRNQARIRLVAWLAARFGVDALLMMETGSDVGTAVTAVSDQVQALVAERPCHPLVSAATHALPTLELRYLGRTLGRPTGHRMTALRVLSECYDVTPDYASLPVAVTAQQLADAYALLWWASPGVRAFGEELGAAASVEVDGQCFPSPAWCARAASLLVQATELGEDFTIVHAALEELAQWNQQYANQYPDNPVQHVLAARDIVTYCRGRGWEALAGAAELAELAFLFGLHACRTIEPTRAQRLIHRATRDQPPSAALLAYLLTGVQRLDLVCPDQDLGPVRLAEDEEVLYEATRRLGLTDQRSETYGVVYRPSGPGLLDTFLNAPCVESGDPDAPAYRILRSGAQGTLLAQQPAAALRGRSALQLVFPATQTVRVPVLLLHNRFSANPDIDHRIPELTVEENGIAARLDTLANIAWNVAAEGPLILGDFNTPRAYLDDEPRPVHAAAQGPWVRRGQVRLRHRAELACAGYVRRTVPAAHVDTSLVSVANLAAGAGLFSEPYDAVYQPFDFLDGAVRVRSAVVAHLAAFFADPVLAQQVDVERVVPDPAADDAVVDDDDQGADAGADVMPDDAPPTVAVTVTVWEACCMELARAYRSILRGVLSTLEDAEAFAPSVGPMIVRSGRFDLADPAGYVGGCRAELVAYCAAAAAAFERDVVRDPRAVLAVGPHFETLRAHALALADALRDKGAVYRTLVARIDAIRLRAQGLEQHADRRLWVIYRMVISDHLPVLVELDLAP